MDIDIGSSVVAYNTVSLAIGYAKGLVVDMGFCVQVLYLPLSRLVFACRVSVGLPFRVVAFVALPAWSPRSDPLGCAPRSYLDIPSSVYGVCGGHNACAAIDRKEYFRRALKARLEGKNAWMWLGSI